MAATDAEQHFISLIDAAIARVAHQARDDRDCALLLAELEAIKKRVLTAAVRDRQATF